MSAETFSKRSKVINELKKSLNTLCHTDHASLETLSIKQCNAASKYGIGGIPFSKAFVEVKEHRDDGDEHYLFGLIFEEYVGKLHSYLDKPDIEPSNEKTKLVFSKLLKYMLDTDQQKVLHTTVNERNFGECDVAVILAEHLFSKLSVSPNYIIDRQYPRSKSAKFCQCGCNVDVRSHYGDTSIGNRKVWHGNIDILVGSLPVFVDDVDEEVPDSPWECSSIEVKRCKCLENPDLTYQILAQTIVFSFLQKQRHPELTNFLIPSVGVSRDGIIFYFYDSEKDVLLKSRYFPFVSIPGKVSPITILATWFVVNYQFLCSGLKLKYFKNVKKANFLNLVDPVLPIFQNELSLGDVRSNKSVVEYNPALDTQCTLVGFDETNEASPCKKLRET